jgi:hypothetical protein
VAGNVLAYVYSGPRKSTTLNAEAGPCSRLSLIHHIPNLKMDVASFSETLGISAYIDTMQSLWKAISIDVIALIGRKVLSIEKRMYILDSKLGY